MKSSPQIWSCLRIRFLLGAMLMFVAAVACAQTVSLPEPPQGRATSQVLSLTLHAVNKNGRDAFAFNGAPSTPTLPVSPRQTLRIEYVTDLPPRCPESCAVNPGMDT